MTRKMGGMTALTLCLLGAFVSLTGISSCTPLEGSETNWFGVCTTSGDCSDGASCVCGTCTIPCSTHASCSDVSSVLRCSGGDSLAYQSQCGGPAPVEQGLCLRGCTTDPECGSDGTCAGGACVQSVLGRYQEPLILAETPPAPISGGSLTVLAQQERALVSDPDRDQIAAVDLEAARLAWSVQLAAGDEPGRIVEGANGRVHVALRRGGAVASLDAATGHVLARTAVCQYPRGIAYDSATDLLHVGCVGGELVTLPGGGGEPIRTLQLDDDLRDVVVYGDKLVVSRFRSAELLVLDRDGNVLRRAQRPAAFRGFGSTFFDARVAWRTVSAAPHGVLVVHHELVEPNRNGDAGTAQDSPGESWGAEDPSATCPNRARAVVSVFDPNGSSDHIRTLAVLPTILPVDLAYETSTAAVAVASAAARPPSAKGLSSARQLSLQPILDIFAAQALGSSVGLPDPETFCQRDAAQPLPTANQVVAVAFDRNGRLVMQTREPSAVVVDSKSVALPGPSRRDTGHELFHLPTRSGLACASCHPEGRDDGHTWTLVPNTVRRTQSLAGGITGTEPLHWAGDIESLDELMEEVMFRNMLGPKLEAAQVGAVERFIDAIPPWQPLAIPDVSAVARGRALFESREVGCAGCHSGPRFTNNETVDVGTGEPLQVPSLLGVSRRAPYMHDGCAGSLLDRFSECGGGDAHGVTSHLSEAQLSDLVSYMRSL